MTRASFPLEINGAEMIRQVSAPMQAEGRLMVRAFLRDTESSVDHGKVSAAHR